MYFSGSSFSGGHDRKLNLAKLSSASRGGSEMKQFFNFLFRKKQPLPKKEKYFISSRRKVMSLCPSFILLNRTAAASRQYLARFFYLPWKKRTRSCTHFRVSQTRWCHEQRGKALQKLRSFFCRYDAKWLSESTGGKAKQGRRLILQFRPKLSEQASKQPFGH